MVTTTWPSVADVAVWTRPGSAGRGADLGPGRRQRRRVKAHRAQPRRPRRRAGRRTPSCRGGPRSRSAPPPSAAPGSPPWPRRWRARRPSAAPPGPARCRRRGARGPAPSDASECPGLPDGHHRAVGGQLPGDGLLERVAAPEREQLEERAAGRGDGGQRQRVVGERAQVQQRCPVVDGQEAPGVGPPEGAGDPEEHRAERRHQRGRRARRRTPTPRGESPRRSDQCSWASVGLSSR